MLQRHPPSSRRTQRWFVCCCLFVALPLACLSTLLSAMLGPVHFHAVPAIASAVDGGMAGWQDFRRVHHVADSGLRLHDHSRLGRHHHDAADPGVVVVGADDHEDTANSATPAAGAALVLSAPLALALVVPAPPATPAVRRPAPPCRFASCDLPRLDRPPIA